ncbi:MAG: response regulator transcription factor [Flavobacterium sp.]|uniref:LytR/AlgR family response regulator transcription factor n=1 Tax=Flavobacterium sp. TaxID=239 RepID=UPI0011FE4260|nr:LytTR family DNA-binding domain-containing protein [Flavobacterium sp.]RZJ68026.1 MAG: response regulator transcription factor [Flavobacterium sp.]
MKHSYVIISDNRDDIAETKAVAALFQQLSFAGSAMDYGEGLDLILEKSPSIVFLEIQPQNLESKLGLSLINELYRYLKTVPKIIVTSKNADLAYEALKYDVLDYLITPFRSFDLRKTVLKFEKQLEYLPVSIEISAPIVDELAPMVAEVLPVIDESFDEPQTLVEEVVEEPSQPEFQIAPIREVKPLIICVKSYGDYRFIEAKDICYLQADNNSTDIHLYNGEMITAFKTLKHFESVLTSPFVRIHNSYIVNIDYVSRIHNGNSVCYIKNTSIKLPFSKSYKENVDAIINSITNGNYLEI